VKPHDKQHSGAEPDAEIIVDGFYIRAFAKHRDVDDQLAVVCENKGRRREFAGKPNGMNKQTRKTKLLEDGFMTAPGQSMHHNQILAVLRQHGFAEGRLIAFSKSGYRKYYRGHFVVFNAQIFSRRGRVLKTADLDLTLDAEKLNAAARVVGENFFVLEENSPNPFWQCPVRPNALHAALCCGLWC
jgi:hypothetical protein